MVLGQRAGFSVTRSPLRPLGTWIIPSIPRGSPYWSTLWYIEQSLDEKSGQIIAPQFIKIVEREPWQHAAPHYDVAILDQDLRDEPERNILADSDPHVFASCQPNLATAISVYRLRSIGDPEHRRTALRRLAIHAFGHVLDLPSSRRQENVELARGQINCLNTCSMRFASSVTQLVDLGSEEHDSRIIFCKECTEDILDHVVRTHFSTN